jgi:endonuclease YncB( thermonuclease family)
MLRTLRVAVLMLSVNAGPAAAGDEPEYRWVEDGTAEAIDGQTIRFNGKVMRLWGVSAPALDQTCQRRDGSAWACGQWSQGQLAILIGRESLKCFGLGDGPGHDGVEVVQCWNSRYNLNYSVIMFGAALAYRPDNPDRQILGSERLASQNGVGLWSGTFDLPWQYRARKGGI